MVNIELCTCTPQQNTQNRISVQNVPYFCNILSILTHLKFSFFHYVFTYNGTKLWVYALWSFISISNFTWHSHNIQICFVLFCSQFTLQILCLSNGIPDFKSVHLCFLEIMRMINICNPLHLLLMRLIDIECINSQLILNTKSCCITKICFSKSFHYDSSLYTNNWLWPWSSFHYIFFSPHPLQYST